MSMGPPAGSLVIDNLTAGYGRRPVLNGLGVAPLAPGTITALVGPNGAGKSTLLRAIAGILPAAGTIRLGPDDLLTMDPALRSARMGFMPQQVPPGAALTVLESVIVALKATPLAGLGRSMRHARERAVAVLDDLGITHLGGLPLDALSGGQRQIASLAQAVARRPDLILLDEPTSALDLRHQVQVMTLVRRLAEEGRVVVVVLHDLTFAARWADRLVVLAGGACDSEGPPEEILTPAMLARVYGVEARVETCSRGRLVVVADRLADADSELPGGGANAVRHPG